MPGPEYSAAQVVARTTLLSESAQHRLRPEMTPRQFLDALREAEHHVDGLRYLPHLLDRRRAVWWACLCCFDAYRDGMPPALSASLAAVLRWVAEPSEAHRQACHDGDEMPALNRVEACLRMAAHWSAGSMLPPHLPEVLPPPDLTAQLCTGAVLLAAASHGMFEIADRHRLYLHLGYEVLDDRLPWSVARTPAAPPSTLAGVA